MLIYEVLLAVLQIPMILTVELVNLSLLRSNILINGYDVFGVSKTWLDSNSDINLNIEGYHPPVHKDFKRGQRGILVYIATNLSARRRQDLEPPGKDFICAEVQTKDRKC